jgi:hypothetical protein
MWIETVEGLDNARQRMESLAAHFPGKYFVYCQHNRAVLAETDTTQGFIRVGNRTQTLNPA